MGEVVGKAAAAGCGSRWSSSHTCSCSDGNTINKTKYLMIFGIHKSTKTEFIIKLN